jgi:hypothetical protein
MKTKSIVVGVFPTIERNSLTKDTKMTISGFTNKVYIIGTDTSNLAPNIRIEAKIGMSKNNQKNHKQRIAEHKRHLGNDIVFGTFPTNEGDAAVRKYLCYRFPDKIAQDSAREVVSLLVEDRDFLIDQMTRYFNAVNSGNSPYDDDVKSKSFLSQDEQVECLDKTESWMRDPINIGRTFLWDCKMRFGKTHTTYELIMRMDFNLILILTNRPTDTKKSWIDAMDHVDFDFGVNNFIDASTRTDPITPIANDRTIIFASLQDFATPLLKDKFSNFPNLIFDLVVCDESHIAFDTENTKNALDNLRYNYMLHLSGTPFKALLDNRFGDDDKFTWSYINEQRVRNIEIEAASHPNSGLLKTDGKHYWNCPMTIFTILLSEELYKEAFWFTEDEGFTFTKLFATNGKDDELTWLNGTAVYSFLDAISIGKIMPYSNQAHGCHQYKHPVCLKHALWCLPGVKEVKLMAKTLREHKVFKQYDIIVAAGDNEGEDSNTVREVQDRIRSIEEKTPRNTEHKGTITLTCGKLSHGVSVPEWGSVFIFSDLSSTQLYFQIIFRGQTPWKVGNKKACYVFDFNPNRTLSHFNTLAATIAGSGDVNPILNEMLEVFNVMCYEGNVFKSLDASDLMSKLNDCFGRSTSLLGIQTLFSELDSDIDDMDLGNDLEGIEGGSASKSKDIKVNENPGAPNGKNSRHVSGDGDNNDDPDNKDGSDNPLPKTDKVISDEDKKERRRKALRAVPLFLFCNNSISFDEFLDSLDQSNDRLCRAMTGLQSRTLRKILLGQIPEKKNKISEAIRRFRCSEIKDNDDIQNELNDFIRTS